MDYERIEEVSIPKSVYTGTGDQLFDFLASTIKNFMAKCHAQQNGCAPAPADNNPGGLPAIGFCFSFAMEQTALNAGAWPARSASHGKEYFSTFICGS